MEDARLIIAGSEENADLFYLTQFLALDAFVMVETHAGQPDARRYIMVSALEYGRAKVQADVHEVLLVQQWQDRAEKAGLKNPDLADAAVMFLRELGIDRVQVQDAFAVAYANRLRQEGLEVRVVGPLFVPERLVKSSKEIASIEKAQAAAQEAMQAAIGMLQRAEIRNEGLFLDNGPLTSERVRRCMHHVLLEADCIGRHTIVAGGAQSCDPHRAGSGALPAHQPIVLDVFPQDEIGRYHADMTRTVVRGRASEELKKLYQAVKDAQQIGISQITAGAQGRAIHQSVQSCFEKRGYTTTSSEGLQEGFIHGTGHGVGLEIHEPPRISNSDTVLEEGMVVTVEPGLYYRAIGGVRLEDLVLVECDGCRNFTDFPKDLEIG